MPARAGDGGLTWCPQGENLGSANPVITANLLMRVETEKQKDNAVARGGGDIATAVESILRDQNGSNEGGVERSTSSSRAPQRVMAGVKTCSDPGGDIGRAGETTAQVSQVCEIIGQVPDRRHGSCEQVPPTGNDREHNQVKSANVSIRDNAEATSGGDAVGAVESGAKRQTAARLVEEERSSSASLAPDGSTEHKAMTRSDLRSDAETRGETTRAPALAGGNSIATRATSSEDGGRPRSGIDGVLSNGASSGSACLVAAEPGDDRFPVALPPERRGDAAELLGAIFGDGWFQETPPSWIVAVATSDEYPAWRDRIGDLLSRSPRSSSVRSTWFARQRVTSLGKRLPGVPPECIPPPDAREE